MLLSSDGTLGDGGIWTLLLDQLTYLHTLESIRFTAPFPDLPDAVYAIFGFIVQASKQSFKGFECAFLGPYESTGHFIIKRSEK